MDAINSLGLGGMQNQPAASKSNKLDQEDFIALMLAQISNQDPFEPMENGAFIAQLAQFGTVSGIQDLQASVGALTQSLLSEQSLQASGLIGRSVRVETDVSALQPGTPIEGVVALDSGSASTVINIYRANGDLVKRIELGQQASGLQAFSWDGRDSAGALMPAGSYRIEAQSLQGDTYVGAPVLLDAKVSSITLSNQANGNLLLNLENGAQINFKDVYQIL